MPLPFAPLWKLFRLEGLEKSYKAFLLKCTYIAPPIKNPVRQGSLRELYDPVCLNVLIGSSVDLHTNRTSYSERHRELHSPGPTTHLTFCKVACLLTSKLGFLTAQLWHLKRSGSISVGLQAVPWHGNGIGHPAWWPIEGGWQGQNVLVGPPQHVIRHWYRQPR